jgi:hypothetical protein
MTPMLAELDNYYRQMGIHSMKFRCCRQNACEFATPPGGVFTDAKPAYVGTANSLIVKEN